MTIAAAILAIIQNAPTAIKEATALYEAVRHMLNATEQADIDAALASAQASDQAATDKADEALDEAAKS